MAATIGFPFTSSNSLTFCNPFFEQSSFKKSVALLFFPFQKRSKRGERREGREREKRREREEKERERERRETKRDR